MYFFFDLQKINTFLELYYKDSFQGTLYLIDEHANNLSLPISSNEHTIVTNSEVIKTLQTAITNQAYYTTYKDKHLYIEPIYNTNLYLVNIVSYEVLKSDLLAKQSGILNIGIISILLITSLSILVSLFVTRPLHMLMDIVQSMKDNTYKKNITLPTTDEIQQLGNAIHTMYETIQQQIVTIQQQEKKNIIPTYKC